MKTNLKFLLITLGSFIILIIFTFCNCDENNPNGYPKTLIYPLSKDTLLFPYSGTDTLVFLIEKDSLLDTAVFIGQGKIYFNDHIEEQYDGFGQISVLGAAYKIVFKNPETNESFEFKIAGREGTLIFSYEVNKILFWDVTWIVDNNTYGGYIGTSEFCGRKFYKVIFITGENKENSKLYLNSTNGFIFIEFNLNSHWTLIN